MKKAHILLLSLCLLAILVVNGCLFPANETIVEDTPASDEPTELCPAYSLADFSGTAYYVCDCSIGADSDCQAGNDENSGLSPSLAWQSYEKARAAFATIEAGDMIAFCRGGSFDIEEYDNTKWVNSNCQSENPCVIKDYTPEWASDDEGRPIINANGANYGFKFDNSGYPEHQEGYVFLNLDIRGSGAANGFFFYNDIDNVTVCNVGIDFFDIGFHMAGANEIAPEETNPEVNRKNSHISLLGSQISNCAAQGVLGQCDHCVIQGNYFQNNGYGRAVYNHNIYISGTADNKIQNGLISDNELYRSAFIDYKCQGVSLVVHGQVDGLIIENNIVREDINGAGPGCWGIAVDTGYSYASEAFRNVTIKNNLVSNLGGVSIGLNGCQNCAVKDNIIINEQSGDTHNAIAVPNRERGEDDQALDAMTVSGNTIYMGAGVEGTAIRLGGEGTAHKSSGNEIYYDGTGDFTCFRYDLPLMSYGSINSNNCYAPHLTSLTWEEDKGDLSTWQIYSSFDQNSTISDPGFLTSTHQLKALIGVTPTVDPEPDTTPDTPVYQNLPEETAPILTAAICPSYTIPSASGGVYYICDCATGADTACEAGNDDNSGTTPESPWQSYEKARSQFSSLAAGDIIAFCRGGAFDIGESASTQWNNSNCDVDTPCVVQDYAPNWDPSNDNRPIIRARGATHGFSFSENGYPDHEEGYVFQHLDIRGQEEGNGFFLFNDIDSVTVCDVNIESFSIGFHVAGANQLDPDETDPQVNRQNESISLLNSTIVNNPGQGWLGGCNHCVIQGNTFDNNGFGQAVYNHNIYLSGATNGPAYDMKVIDNELYHSAIINGSCQGVSLVVHGKVNGLLIENNLVQEDLGSAGGGCWGIAVDTGYGSIESFTDVIIRRNKVVNVGNISIGLNACQDCFIENNVVINNQDNFSQVPIAAANRTRSVVDSQMERVTVRNNSIYLGPNTEATGIKLEGDGFGHRSVNNVVQYDGSGDFNCFQYGLNQVLYYEIDNNICYTPNAASVTWESDIGDLSTWQTATGFDVNSMNLNPEFTAADVSSGDLSPSSASSPLVDTGHQTLGSLYTVDGVTRDEQPDIGAYEY